MQCIYRILISHNLLPRNEFQINSRDGLKNRKQIFLSLFKHRKLYKHAVAEIDNVLQRTVKGYVGGIHATWWIELGIP